MKKQNRVLVRKATEISIKLTIDFENIFLTKIELSEH